MKILAWDTSSKSGAIVALESDESRVRMAGEWSLSVDSRHSERLLWGAHQLLEASGWKIEEIDLFGAGVGPGSFTGLRIGITTARTLAHALGKPLVGVSSLAVLARPAALWLEATGLKDTLLIAATDACKGELFALWGQASQVAGCASVDGLWKRAVHEEVLTPDQLSGKLKKSGKRWLAVGEGRARYPELWKSLPAKKEIRAELPFSDQVQGRYLGLAVWEAYRAGLASDALGVHPRYLRGSDAEVKLKAGLLKPAPQDVPAAFRGKGFQE